MPSDPRKECPSCLRPTASADDWKTTEIDGGTHLCWGEGVDMCYQIQRNMQDLAPDMVRLLERLVAAWDNDRFFDLNDATDEAVALLSRAKGDPQ
jgi:hypothetical protein